MEIAHRWGDRNLTRMELVIALLILALLIGFFSRYTLVVLAQAERSMVSRTVLNINAALNLRITLAKINREYDELKYLLNSNPLKIMREAIIINEPGNANPDISLAIIESTSSTSIDYIDIHSYDSLELMVKGRWYYILDEHILVYTVRNSEFFNSDIEGLPRVRFGMIIDYNDINNNGQYDLSIDKFNSVKYESIDEYQWVN